METQQESRSGRAPLCPTCTQPAISEGLSVVRGVATNHCTCQGGHIWIVRWMVAA